MLTYDSSTYSSEEPPNTVPSPTPRGMISVGSLWRKKEEGQRKKVEGRRTKEEGRRTKERMEAKMNTCIPLVKTRVLIIGYLFPSSCLVPQTSTYHFIHHTSYISYHIYHIIYIISYISYHIYHIMPRTWDAAYPTTASAHRWRRMRRGCRSWHWSRRRRRPDRGGCVVGLIGYLIGVNRLLYRRRRNRIVVAV